MKINVHSPNTVFPKPPVSQRSALFVVSVILLMLMLLTSLIGCGESSDNEPESDSTVQPIETKDDSESLSNPGSPAIVGKVSPSPTVVIVEEPTPTEAPTPILTPTPTPTPAEEPIDRIGILSPMHFFGSDEVKLLEKTASQCGLKSDKYDATEAWEVICEEYDEIYPSRCARPSCVRYNEVGRCIQYDSEISMSSGRAQAGFNWLFERGTDVIIICGPGHKPSRLTEFTGYSGKTVPVFGPDQIDDSIAYIESNADCSN